MYILYRISDGGNKKHKPSYINNKNCLLNAVNTFRYHTFHIIADYVSDETFNMITEVVKDVRHEILRTHIGNGAGTFNISLDDALSLPDDDIVYFLEDDYLHKPFSYDIMLEGLNLGANYLSLYDHPDKYVDGPNPYVVDGGEETKVFLTKSCHWKFTNSTTMTFAGKVKDIRDDEAILRKYTNKGTHPYDFDMWIELRKKGKSLITPIPGYSTHGEVQWLSPLTDWSKI